MKRPGYREAVEWLAGNDDCNWLIPGEPGGISVAAALVRDLFDMPDEKLKTDIRRALKRIYPTHAAVA
jgi:hypothetical protein